MRTEDLGRLGRLVDRLVAESGAEEIRIRIVGGNVEVSAVHAGKASVVAEASEACTLSREGKVRYTRRARSAESIDR